MIIDVLTLLLSLICSFLMFRIWHFVKGRGRVLLIIAFLYASLVRGLVIVNDLAQTDFPTTNLIIGFWALITVGLWILLGEIKSLRR